MYKDLNWCYLNPPQGQIKFLYTEMFDKDVQYHSHFFTFNGSIYNLKWIVHQGLQLSKEHTF